jgi:hypothetical protein
LRVESIDSEALLHNQMNMLVDAIESYIDVFMSGSLPRTARFNKLRKFTD